MLDDILLTIEKAEMENNRQFVTALARGLGILYLTRQYPYGMSYQQICEATKLPKPTVTRLLRTLMDLRFIRQNPVQGLYQADIRLLELTSSHKSIDVTEKIKPLLMNFATEHHVSVSLAVYQFGEMLYLQSIRSPARVAVQLQVGSTVPMPDTAIGRAYYAGLDKETKQMIQRELIRLYPRNYSEKIDTLEKQDEFMRKYGYTFSDREFSDEIIAVAITVKHALAPHGIYAINVSVPSSKMEMKTLIKKIARPLSSFANQIQTYLVD